MKEFREYLIELGCDTSIDGGKFFVDLLEEVVCLLQDGFTDEEVVAILPSICLEYYHFYYEISKFEYYSKIMNFVNNCEMLKSVNLNNSEIKDNNFFVKLLYVGKKYIEDLDSEKKLKKGPIK